MDPLSTLSIATGIVTFVDFGSAVIEPTKPIPPPGVGLGLGSSGGLGLRKSRVELAYLVG